jgi:hypothetical protein
VIGVAIHKINPQEKQAIADVFPIRARSQRYIGRVSDAVTDAMKTALGYGDSIANHIKIAKTARNLAIYPP